MDEVVKEVISLPVISTGRRRIIYPPEKFVPFEDYLFAGGADVEFLEECLSGSCKILSVLRPYIEKVNEEIRRFSKDSIAEYQEIELDVKSLDDVVRLILDGLAAYYVYGNKDDKVFKALKYIDILPYALYDEEVREVIGFDKAELKRYIGFFKSIGLIRCGVGRRPICKPTFLGRLVALLFNQLTFAWGWYAVYIFDKFIEGFLGVVNDAFGKFLKGLETEEDFMGNLLLYVKYSVNDWSERIKMNVDSRVYWMVDTFFSQVGDIVLDFDEALFMLYLRAKELKRKGIYVPRRYDFIKNYMRLPEHVRKGSWYSSW